MTYSPPTTALVPDHYLGTNDRAESFMTIGRGNVGNHTQISGPTVATFSVKSMTLGE